MAREHNRERKEKEEITVLRMIYTYVLHVRVDSVVLVNLTSSIGMRPKQKTAIEENRNRQEVFSSRRDP